MFTVGQAAPVREQGRGKATPPAPPTRRHGEEVSSEGWRGGEGEVPVVTRSGDPVAETGLSRSTSHLPSIDCKERET